MIQYLKLPFSFNVAKMQEATEKIGSEYWHLHFQTKHYTGNWSAIPLRSIGGNINNSLIDPTETAIYKDTFLLHNSTYFNEILQQFKCPLLAVRLLKLEANAKIHEHSDGGLCYEDGIVRFHIPVFTNPLIDFYLNNEKMDLQEGECWYMNFNLKHKLHNKSEKDRIHLVIDAQVNEWITELFNSQEITIKKIIDKPDCLTTENKRAMIASLKAMNTTTSLAIAQKLADEIGEKFN